MPAPSETDPAKTDPTKTDPAKADPADGRVGALRVGGPASVSAPPVRAPVWNRGQRVGRRRSHALRRPDFLRITRLGERLGTRYFLVFVQRRAQVVSPSEPRGEAGDVRADTSLVSGGQSASGEVFSAPARLGITVTRKVGNAVRRNRIKRLVREWFRRCNAGLQGLDLVVIAKREIPATLRQVQVAQDLERVVRAAERHRAGSVE